MEVRFVLLFLHVIIATELEAYTTPIYMTNDEAKRAYQLSSNENSDYDILRALADTTMLFFLQTHSGR